MTLTNEAISAAQGLASLGWLVFPVNPDTKAPLITGWQSRATCDRCSIIDLFKDYPWAAIGLSSPNFLYQYFSISLLVFQVLEVAYLDRDAA